MPENITGFLVFENTTINVSLSIEFLSEFLISRCFLLLFSISGSIASIFTSLAIFNGKNLRSRYYKGSFHAAIVNFLCCLCITIVASKKLALSVLGIGEVSSVVSCASLFGAYVTSALLSLLQYLNLSVDRCIVALNLTEKYTDKLNFVNLFLWLVGLIISLILHLKGLQNSTKTILVCIKSTIYTQWGSAYIDITFVSIACFTIALNLISLIIIRFKVSRVFVAIPNIAIYNRQHRIFRIITVIILSEVLIWLLVNHVISRIMILYHPDWKEKLDTFIAMTFAIQPTLNLMFYTSMDAEFQRSLLKFGGCQAFKVYLSTTRTFIKVISIKPR